MFSYNVFSTRQRDMFCAVPEDRPVPSFLTGKSWEFRGKIGQDGSIKLPRSFKVAVRFNGFYIFHALEITAPPWA